MDVLFLAAEFVTSNPRRDCLSRAVSYEDLLSSAKVGEPGYFDFSLISSEVAFSFLPSPT